MTRTRASSATGISSIVFDFGGVLITPITNILEEIATWHDVPMVTMLDVLMGPRERSTPDHPWHRAERGETSTAAMQVEVAPFAKALSVELRGDEYGRLLRGDFLVHDDVIARIAALRDEGYTIGLLTNSFREFRPVLESRIDVSLFDVVVDSSEVGHRKPEPRIYEIVGERLGVPGREILYLDDFDANLVGARLANWQTIHVTDIAAALAELDAALGDTGHQL